MEARNPDNEKPDPRSLAKKLEDEGTAPTFKETGSEESESEEASMSDYDHDKDMSPEMDSAHADLEEEGNKTNNLLKELDKTTIRTIDDLRRIKDLVTCLGGE